MRRRTLQTNGRGPRFARLSNVAGEPAGRFSRLRRSRGSRNPSLVRGTAGGPRGSVQGFTRPRCRSHRRAPAGLPSGSP
jgi:hypothetical protein